ncbi:MAG: hypothetical protein SCH66_12440 [Methanolobus sp.]|nr:hypothetical protein [Methanolobus sp.]
MSGELIGEFQGKAIGMRIVGIRETESKIEVAGQITSHLLGTKVEGLGTALEVYGYPVMR